MRLPSKKFSRKTEEIIFLLQQNCVKVTGFSYNLDAITLQPIK